MLLTEMICQNKIRRIPIVRYLLCAVLLFLLLPVCAEEGTPEGWADLGIRVVTREGTTGAVVEQLYPESVASASDLRVGDVIVGIDEVVVTRANDYVEAIHARKPGQKVLVSYTRGEHKSSLTLTLGVVAPENNNGNRFHFPPARRGYLAPQGDRVVYRFDFVLSCTWDATMAEMDGVRKMVEGAAPFFFDGTEGTMAYGHVKIYNHSEHLEDADFMVMYDKNLKGVGVSGWASLRPAGQLNLAMHRDAMNSPNASRVFFHEMSHLFFGLGDEYGGNKMCHCAMGMGPFQNYFEYCTDTSHDFFQKESCWHHLTRYYPEVKKRMKTSTGPVDCPKPEFTLYFERTQKK